MMYNETIKKDDRGMTLPPKKPKGKPKPKGNDKMNIGNYLIGMTRNSVELRAKAITSTQSLRSVNTSKVLRDLIVLLHPKLRTMINPDNE